MASAVAEPNYEGPWKDEIMMHGQGKLTWPSGTVYEGNFTEHKIMGQGVMTYSSGGRYEGNFELSVKQGQGEMKWANGNHYKGEW